MKQSKSTNKIIFFGIFALVCMSVLLAILFIPTRSSAFGFNEVHSENLEIYESLELHHSHNNINYLDSEVSIVAHSAPKHPKCPESDNPLPMNANDGMFHGRHLITNYRFFKNGPRHGVNGPFGINDSCGPVAAQLLLTYHNFFSDRRIIDDQFLFPGQGNPNIVLNPNTQNSHTTGSRPIFLQHLVDNYIPILGWLIHGTLITGVGRGMSSFLAGRRLNQNGGANFSVHYSHNLGVFGIGTYGIKNQLRANMPVIVGMHESIGGINHFVIAFGYQYFNGVFGWIVHYGWDPHGSTDYTFAWIDARWANSYISMMPGRVHNHVATDIIVANHYREYHCSICGHRVIRSLFRTSQTTGGIAINAFATGFNAPANMALHIPDYIYGQRVVAISASAFAGNVGITHVSISYTVTSIGIRAFYRTAIWNNTPNGSAVYVHNWAVDFRGHGAHYTLRAGTRGISDFAFANLWINSSLDIPSSVEHIGTGAFGEFSTTIVVTYIARAYIPARLFENTGLRYINIANQNAVTSIGYRAFANTRLTHFMMPPNVTHIDTNAFYGTSSLASLNITTSGTTAISLGANVFSGTNIISITFSNWNTVDAFRTSTYWSSAFAGRLHIFTAPLRNATPPIPQDLTALVGQTLSNVTLPARWRWENTSVLVGAAGRRYDRAIYTPVNQERYRTTVLLVPIAVHLLIPNPPPPQNLTAQEGQRLSEVPLPARWHWENPNAFVGAEGARFHRAIYTPANQERYAAVVRAITVRVYRTPQWALIYEMGWGSCCPVWAYVGLHNKLRAQIFMFFMSYDDYCAYIWAYLYHGNSYEAKYYECYSDWPRKSFWISYCGNFLKIYSCCQSFWGVFRVRVYAFVG